MRVLLVEDDDAVAESLTRGLSRYGFDVQWVRTGGEALRAEVGDVVLLDLGLPDVDGLDVCRELRARSDVPIIVISARADETDRVVGLEIGADDYVSKPFGVREVIARMRAVLRRVRPATEPDLRALASPGHLEQVLDNVLSNALEVSPDDATVTVRSFLDDGKAILEVVDHGPGMPAADRQRAFDRFWRGRGLTGSGGSGLGLAIVKQLVTDDGGTVTLHEAEVGGLQVRIALRTPASPTSGG